MKEQRLASAMRIVERNEIDDQRWNALVDGTPEASFFSYTWYLDATAENWCALVNDEYTAGLALPYSVRLGVESLYTPIFVRYIELLGSIEENIEGLIEERFPTRNIAVRQSLWTAISEEWVYQSISVDEERKLGSQAKRMLKKAEKNALDVSLVEKYDGLFELVQGELSGKHEGLTDTSMTSLRQLIKAADEAGVLRVFSLDEGGGIFCLENDRNVLYLKGTTGEEVKKQGGMYLLLDTAIEQTLSKGKTFDFGGSRAEGVRRFNLNLGGADATYFHFVEDKTPFWYGVARKVKRTLGK